MINAVVSLETSSGEIHHTDLSFRSEPMVGDIVDWPQAEGNEPFMILERIWKRADKGISHLTIRAQQV